MIAVEDLLGLGLAPRTAYLYARKLDRAIGLLEARGTDLLGCGPADLAWVAEQFPRSHSARCQLRAALIAAWDLLERHNAPVRALRIPPKPRARCKALSEQAAKQLEAYAFDHQDDDGALAVLIGLYAALRRSELAGLRWDDLVDDETGRPAWWRVWGKGDLSAEVPIHPVLASVLAPARRRTGWVFPGRRPGTHCSPATVWTRVGRLARAAGLVAVPTHVLRHTALADCNDRSGDLRAVQEIARHSRPETTAGYTRTTAARMMAVVSMIDYGRRIA